MENIEDIDALEDAIDEAGIDHCKILALYRDLILRLVEMGWFRTIPKEDMQKVRKYLDEVPENLRLFDLPGRSGRKAELWKYADENKNNPDLYNLIRCVIFMFSRIEEWDGSQDSLISYLHLFLMRINSAIEPIFLNYFKKELFGIGD